MSMGDVLDPPRDLIEGHQAPPAQVVHFDAVSEKKNIAGEGELEHHLVCLGATLPA